MFGSVIAAAAIAQTKLSFLDQVKPLLTSDQRKAEQLMRAKFKPEDLTQGIKPEAEGLNVLFAIDPGEGKHEGVVEGDNLKTVKLNHVGGLLAAVVKLREGQGTQLRYNVDGKPGKGYNLEVYTPNPFVMGPPGGRKGEMRDMGAWEGDIYKGTTRKWFIYLPPNIDPSHEYPVLIGTDAQWDKDWQANALENCAREGKIPPTVGVFIEAGQLKAGDGFKHRADEYDVLNDDYSKFLLTEILPQVEKIVKLSKDPAKRATTGVSSGGICGFTSCWEHPESFGVLISCVGSFDDIKHGESLKDGGHNYPFFIRLTPKKPIRVFLQDGTHDLDNDFGNWFLGNAQMAAALKYKGYDVQWHPGEGFHSSDHIRSIYDKALVWWNGIK